MRSFRSANALWARSTMKLAASGDKVLRSDDLKKKKKKKKKKNLKKWCV